MLPPLMLTCSKTYSDVPLGHRQPHHHGHCACIHGHNWEIKVTFQAADLDEHGFVVDFGELHYLKDWIDEHLDHACAFSSTDPQRQKIEELVGLGLIKPLWIENVSCEGFAKYLFETFDPMVRENTGGRVQVVSIELFEDSRNSVLYHP